MASRSGFPETSRNEFLFAGLNRDLVATVEEGTSELEDNPKGCETGRNDANRSSTKAKISTRAEPQNCSQISSRDMCRDRVKCHCYYGHKPWAAQLRREGACTGAIWRVSFNL